MRAKVKTIYWVALEDVTRKYWVLDSKDFRSKRSAKRWALKHIMRIDTAEYSIKIMWENEEGSGLAEDLTSIYKDRC